LTVGKQVGSYWPVKMPFWSAIQQYQSTEGIYSKWLSNLTKRLHRRCIWTVHSYSLIAPMCIPCSFLRPTRVHIPDGTLIGSAIFAQLMAKSPLYFTMGRSFPLKIAPSHAGIWTAPAPSNTWFLEPTRVQYPKCISIGSTIFAVQAKCMLTL